jgi:two-component system, chemotaxis family, sensor kinase CheA
MQQLFLESVAKNPQIFALEARSSADRGSWKAYSTSKRREISMTQQIEQDAALLQDYLTECEEILQQLDQDLVALESAPEDADLLNRIFRAFHTIKGTSGFLGFNHIVELTHNAEDVLNVLRKGERKVTRHVMDILLAALDQLRQMIGDLRSGASREYEIAGLVDDLKKLFAADAHEASARPMSSSSALAVDDKSRSASQASAAVLSVTDHGKQSQARELSAKTGASTTAVESTRTIRVDVTKLDELINLVGELVLERNRLHHLSRSFSERGAGEDQFASALLQCASRLSFVTDELQTAGLRTRMVPVEAVFRRFPRLVRDLAGALGKEVELVIQGEDTELDKTVAEQIVDPLVHLLRNSLDHGIELPAIRIERGKSARGTVRVEARQEGDNIIIEIADDGAGMDHNRIARKALEKGLISQEQLITMSPREILDFIFLPGFSLAEKVSDVSGRGVGMDVVRSNMKKLNGTIELDSELGKGSCIRLRLPLTLAILPVLLVSAAHETYALPLRSVVETVRIRASDVHRANGTDMLRLRDRMIPVCWLRQAIGLPSDSAQQNALLRVVVLATGQRRVGLVVDQLVGQEETVIKSISSHLHKVPGLAGATISGDGEVRLILDPAGLLSHIEERLSERS